MRLSQHKSIKQEDSSLIISTDVLFYFIFASPATDFVYKASQSHTATDYWGFTPRLGWLQLQMPLSSDLVSIADQNLSVFSFDVLMWLGMSRCVT